MIAYDIARMHVEESRAKKLGFERIFAAKELMGYQSKLILASEKDAIRRIREGVKGMVVEDYRVENRLIAEAADKDVALYFALYPITTSLDLLRSKRIGQAVSLFKNAKQKGINIGFVSFAETEAQLCSRIQLLHCAVLVSNNEAYSRVALSETNGIFDDQTVVTQDA